MVDVCCSLAAFVQEYSHDCIAKKRAPTVNQAVVKSSQILAWLKMCVNTHAGKAFWWRVLDQLFEAAHLLLHGYMDVSICVQPWVLFISRPEGLRYRVQGLSGVA